MGVARVGVASGVRVGPGVLVAAPSRVPVKLEGIAFVGAQLVITKESNVIKTTENSKSVDLDRFKVFIGQSPEEPV
jgi:hypothetical protein